LARLPSEASAAKDETTTSKPRWGAVRILRCRAANFRGFDRVEIVPRGHVVLVGEPRAGRTDLLAALDKVFEVDASRLDELDFHNSDLSEDVKIEVVVGDLGSLLQQTFLDQLEFWDLGDVPPACLEFERQCTER
jgi:hypothetical protein